MVKVREHNEAINWALGVVTYEFVVGSPPFEEIVTCPTQYFVWYFVRN